ncbi:DUF1853 family protein [Undibacterium sp.]|uniref:DUF1853 family protein n=1 Tax=Undibacterium sp. TaxID=1914977 RepID=UPI0025EFCC2E|nr:DUF1853 family protein [Undibacterium sp.]
METYQARFHHEWQHLQDVHVRALAWILTSPGLLDRACELWRDKIVDLNLPEKSKLDAWLQQLDRQPTALHEALALHKHRRLGHYAENLLAFFLHHQGLLYAHGLQVHERGTTVGEFDFLLHQGEDLLHWEIASKFYLLVAEKGGTRAPDLYDYLGPNLADTLGSKMGKIFQQQLGLAQHPEAQKLVPKQVLEARALVKGWLFYRAETIASPFIAGVAPDHCRAYWWTLDEIEQLAIPYALLLPRLEWLAPAQCGHDAVMLKDDLKEVLKRHFLSDQSPVLLAIMSKYGNCMQEICRGMVMPNDWLDRAQQKQASLRGSPAS